MKKVIQGSLVAVHYTGTLKDGEVFDSSEDCEPLKFKIGVGSIIKGFEDAILGLESGEEVKVKIPPEKAYGKRNDKRVIKVDRKDFQADFTPEVGFEVTLLTNDSKQAVGLIKEVREDHIVIDLNHPLAGEELNFKIKVIEIHKEGDPGTENWGEETENCECCESCSGEHEH